MIAGIQVGQILAGGTLVTTYCDWVGGQTSEQAGRLRASRRPKQRCSIQKFRLLAEKMWFFSRS